MTVCNYCRKDLPERGHSHVIYAESLGKEIPVCIGCLKDRNLRIVAVIERRKLVTDE